VCWRGETSVEVVAMFFALAKLGAVFVPINSRLSDDEAAPILSKARPQLVIDDRYLAELRVAAGELVQPTADLDERDPHVIFFTSGSTGEPKGAVLSHRANYLRSFRGHEPEVPEPTVCMFPLFHMASWTLALGCWQQRHQICFVETADAASILDTVERWRAARLYCIPAVWARILASDRSARDLSTLRVADTGTSATPPDLLRSIKEALPRTLTRVFYGSTEAGPTTILADEDLARKPGSVGLPAVGVELRIDENGEVCVRSDYLFDGYFEDPEVTSAAVRDGWYRTGDLGILDDDGYLSIVGRARDIIRTGGETVSPTEIEREVATHPAVAEVAVVGLPDPKWGEIVCAVVVLRTGATFSLDELRRHCAGLARFKQPRRLELVEALPRTSATGQVQRTLLVERMVALAEQNR
jgi:fatty-acyl-CoA synthase